MINLDELKADRAAGTQGPWVMVESDLELWMYDSQHMPICQIDWNHPRHYDIATDGRPDCADGRRMERIDALEAAYIAQCEKAPSRYTVGPVTMERVFKAAGLTNVSDLQAVLDAVEQALGK